MSESKKILYATGNVGKFEEVALDITTREPQIELIQFAADIPEKQTLDLRAIAIDKAKTAWKFAQEQYPNTPILVDDAGIYFEKYNQFPGTLTKYIWHGLGFEGIKKLFEEGDQAKFLLYMIYITGPDSYEIFEGTCEGTLVKPTQFTAHPSLPYDAIFKPNGSDKTYEHLRNTPEAEHYLYRLRALQKFLAWYKDKEYTK